MVQQDQTDAALIKQVISGKQECYRPLVDKYQNRVYHLAISMLHHTAEAQDITQEAFLTAYKNIRRLHNHAKFGSWLYGITRNLCMEALRKRKLEPEYVGTDFVEIADRELETEPKVSALNGTDITELLIGKLKQMPEKYQTLLRLKYLQDYSYQQIADMLDMPVDLVRSRLFEGRKLLRDEVTTEIHDDERYHDARDSKYA